MNGCILKLRDGNRNNNVFSFDALQNIGLFVHSAGCVVC